MIICISFEIKESNVVTDMPDTKTVPVNTRDNTHRYARVIDNLSVQNDAPRNIQVSFFKTSKSESLTG